MKIKSTLKSKSIRRRYERRLGQKMAGLAFSGQSMCRRDVESGVLGIVSDTGAMAASFYAATPWRNGYGEAAGNMVSAYTMKYPLEHAQARVAPGVQGISVRRVAFASASKVVGWWDLGHNNAVTGHFEQVPVLRATRDALRVQIPARFVGLFLK